MPIDQRSMAPADRVDTCYETLIYERRRRRCPTRSHGLLIYRMNGIVTCISVDMSLPSDKHK